MARRICGLMPYSSPAWSKQSSSACAVVATMSSILMQKILIFGMNPPPEMRLKLKEVIFYFIILRQSLSRFKRELPLNEKPTGFGGLLLSSFLIYLFKVCSGACNLRIDVSFICSQPARWSTVCHVPLLVLSELPCF